MLVWLRALLSFEGLTFSKLVLHLVVPSFWGILALCKIDGWTKSVRGGEETRLSRSHPLVVGLGRIRLVSKPVSLVNRCLTTIPVHVEIIWHSWRTWIGRLLDLRDQLLQKCILAWVWALGALIVLLEKDLGHVCKLVHVLIVPSLLVGRNWWLVGLIENLGQRLLDSCVRILIWVARRLLMLLEYLSVYHPFDVLRKILEYR